MGLNCPPQADSRYGYLFTFINLRIKDSSANPAIDKVFVCGNLRSPSFTSPQTQSLLLVAAVHSPDDEKLGPA